MAASLSTSLEVVSVEKEHCFRHESEIKKQKKGKVYGVNQVYNCYGPVLSRKTILTFISKLT